MIWDFILSLKINFCKNHGGKCRGLLETTPTFLGLICLRRTLIFFELKYFDSDFPSSDLFNWKTFTFLLVSVLLLFALVDFLGLDKVCGYFTFLCLFSCELLWHSLFIHLGNQINNCCALLIWGVSLTPSKQFQSS